MKIAIISDIHGNLEALTSIKTAIATDKPDMVVCLGDLVGYGANPNECCEIMKEMADITVLGNHDAAASNRLGLEYFNHAAMQALIWTSGSLTGANKGWLGTLPYTSSYDDIGFTHGSPIDPESFDYLITWEQIAMMIPQSAGLPKLSFLGHSHVFGIFSILGSRVEETDCEKIQIKARGKYLISLGSVGQPRDRDRRACYGLYDTTLRKFEHMRVNYDFSTAAAKIRAAGLPPQFAQRLLP